MIKKYNKIIFWYKIIKQLNINIVKIKDEHQDQVRVRMEKGKGATISIDKNIPFAELRLIQSVAGEIIAKYDKNNPIKQPNS